MTRHGPAERRSVRCAGCPSGDYSVPLSRYRALTTTRVARATYTERRSCGRARDLRGDAFALPLFRSCRPADPGPAWLRSVFGAVWSRRVLGRTSRGPVCLPIMDGCLPAASRRRPGTLKRATGIEERTRREGGRVISCEHATRVRGSGTITW